MSLHVLVLWANLISTQGVLPFMLGLVNTLWNYLAICKLMKHVLQAVEGNNTAVGPPDPLHHDEIWYGSIPVFLHLASQPLHAHSLHAYSMV